MLADSHLLKIVLLGDSKVGKTSLMKQYCAGRFDKSYQSTIGADFLTKELFITDNQPITLQIWDTAGQERFKSLVCQFYRGADACILVYDITNAESFERLEFWMDQFIEHADIAHPERFPFLIVGNKIDLAHETKVSESTVRSWCETKGNIQNIQASAKANANVEKAFVTVTQLALELQSDYEDVFTELAPVLKPQDFEIIQTSAPTNTSFNTSGQHISQKSLQQKTPLKEQSKSFTLENLGETYKSTRDTVSDGISGTLERWDCC